MCLSCNSGVAIIGIKCIQIRFRVGELIGVGQDDELSPILKSKNIHIWFIRRDLCFLKLAIKNISKSKINCSYQIKCSWPIRLQDSLKCNISRKKLMDQVDFFLFFLFFFCCCCFCLWVSCKVGMARHGPKNEK